MPAVQTHVFGLGYGALHLFVGLEENREKVPDALIAEPGLGASVGAIRRAVALLLSAWESLRAQLQMLEKQKLEAKVSNQTRLVQASQLFAVRTSVESSIGFLLRTDSSTFAVVCTCALNDMNERQHRSTWLHTES